MLVSVSCCRDSELGRLGRGFLHGNAAKLDIVNCSLVLDTVAAINVTADNFLFTDNIVGKIVTDSVAVRLVDEALIARNNFQHLEEKSFYNIENGSLKIINNSYENFESGFLMLQVGQTVEFERLKLETSCDCSTAQAATASHTNNAEQNQLDNHREMEMLEKNVQCLDSSGEFVGLNNYTKGRCSGETPNKSSTKEEDDSLWAVLAPVLVILGMLLIGQFLTRWVSQTVM